MVFIAVGDDVPQETVDSAAVFLFTLFIEDPTLSRANSEEIRKVLGPFPASAAATVCETVKRVLGLLPTDYKFSSGKDVSEQQMTREFGHNIVFRHAETSQSMQVDSSGYDSLSEDEFEQSSSQKSELLSGFFHGITSHSQPPEELVSAEQETSQILPYSRDWLKKQCQFCCKGGSIEKSLEWKELYASVFDILSSSEDNSGIQNSVSF